MRSVNQPAIVIGSTLMSMIAAYVLASDEIARALAAISRGEIPALSDVFVIVLCGGMGFLVDMAIIVSATRFQMHSVRNDPRENRWKWLALTVFSIGVGSEAMTVFYFFINLDPARYPSQMLAVADAIHNILSVSRAFLMPATIAYFAAGVLPVSYTRADRNRDILARTSQHIMTLLDRLGQVFDSADVVQQIRALGGQLRLATYAEYDQTERSTEAEQTRRDAALIGHIARMNDLDWSEIGRDVAPDMAPPMAPPAPPAPAASPLAIPAPATTPRVALAGDPSASDFRLTVPSAAQRSHPTHPPTVPPAPRRKSPTIPAIPGKPKRNPTPRAGAIGAAGFAGASAPAIAPIGRDELYRRRLAAGRAILSALGDEQRERLTVKDFARRIAMRTKYQCGETTAREIRDKLAEEFAPVLSLEPFSETESEAESEESEELA